MRDAEFTTFRVADYLTDEGMANEYIAQILADGDTAELVSGLQDVADARNLALPPEAQALAGEHQAVTSAMVPTLKNVLQAINLPLSLLNRYTLNAPPTQRPNAQAAAHSAHALA